MTKKADAATPATRTYVANWHIKRADGMVNPGAEIELDDGTARRFGTAVSLKTDEPAPKSDEGDAAV